MRPVPDLNKVDAAFGNIAHMPKYADVPEPFRQWGGTPYNEFVGKWFGVGLKQEDLNRLTPKEGVDAKAALRAISAILRSFEPKHEHKEAGAAYLLSEWFNLAPEVHPADTPSDGRG